MATESAEFGPGKTIFVLAIVVGCFAVLWPKIFYPMLAGPSTPEPAPNTYRGKPVCIPCDIKFEKERNNAFYYELCNLVVLAPDYRRFPPALLFKLCKEKLGQYCGLEVDDDLVERFRKLNETDYNEKLTNFTGCLKAEFNIERYNIIQVLQTRNLSYKHVFPNKRVPQERPNDLRPDTMHPALRERGQNIPPGIRTADRDARPGPVPGMRPTFGGPGPMHGSPKQTSTMSIIMPIYTVAIVIFFIYTIMKILLKKSQDTTPKVQDFHLDPEQRKFVCAEEYTEADPYSIRDYIRQQHERERAAQAKEQLEKENAKIVLEAIEGIVKEIDEYKAQRKKNVTAMKEVQEAVGIVKEAKTEETEVKVAEDSCKEEAVIDSQENIKDVEEDQEEEEEISEYKSVKLEEPSKTVINEEAPQHSVSVVDAASQDITKVESLVSESPTEATIGEREPEKIQEILIEPCKETKPEKTSTNDEVKQSGLDVHKSDDDDTIVYYEDTLSNEAKDFVRQLAEITVQKAIVHAIRILNGPQSSELPLLSHTKKSLSFGDAEEVITEPTKPKAAKKCLSFGDTVEDRELESIKAKKKLSFETDDTKNVSKEELEDAKLFLEDSRLILKEKKKPGVKKHLSFGDIPETESEANKEIKAKSRKRLSFDDTPKIIDDLPSEDTSDLYKGQVGMEELREDIELEEEYVLEEEEIDDKIENLMSPEERLSDEARTYVRYLGEMAVNKAIEDAKLILTSKELDASTKAELKSPVQALSSLSKVEGITKQLVELDEPSSVQSFSSAKVEDTPSNIPQTSAEEEQMKEALEEALKEAAPIEHTAVVHDGSGQSAILLQQVYVDMDGIITNPTASFHELHQFYIAEVVDVKHKTFDEEKQKSPSESSQSSFEMMGGSNNGDITSSFEHLSRNGSPPQQT